MPTGHALQDPRRQLFAAAERILLRDGASGLTGRSVTAEAGVAKGVLHRHFTDFDTFVAHLVDARISGFAEIAERLTGRVGLATLSENVSTALLDLLDPVVLALVPQVIAYDGIRRRISTHGRPGLPLLTDAAAVIRDYFERERQQGRIVATADLDTAALSVIATGHLLLAGEIGARPTTAAVGEIVDSILVGIERGPRPG